MRKLHTFAYDQRFWAGLFKQLLAEEGIDCLLRNDQLSGAVGEIPFIECFPELWIIDDESWPRARLLLKGWMKDEPEGEPWTCPRCGERLEAQFGCCWNCEQPRN